jgi:hypothetical protein
VPDTPATCQLIIERWISLALPLNLLTGEESKRFVEDEDSCKSLDALAGVLAERLGNLPADKDDPLRRKLRDGVRSRRGRWTRYSG